MQKVNELNPIYNVLKTEWAFLGKRKKIFLFYITLFVISGTLGLLNPLIIGFIFNSIQQNISSPEELNHLIFMIFLFFVDFKIAIFSLVFSLIILWITITFDKRIVQCYKEVNIFSNKLSASIFDYLSNIFTVVTLRLKKTVEKEIDYRLSASYDVEKRKAFLLEAKWGFASIAIVFMTVLVLSYKAYVDYYSTGVILIGTLYLLYSYLNRVGNTFFNFANIYTKIAKYDSKIYGAYPIDEAYDLVDNRIEGKLPVDWNEISLKNLSFTYDDDGKKLHIDNVNINFKRGQKIALMRGLYFPDKGNVYVNGLEINGGIQKLKRHITLIPQEPEIFNNTIGFNITMDLNVKKSDLQKAINMAQFGDVVRRLRDGLDTNVLEKGVSLSGGEKQRLALARGLLAAKGRDIVLFDETTSSVDSLNEMKIHDNIFREFKS